MKLSFQVDSGHYISDSDPLSYRECINLFPSTPIAEGASSSGGLFSFPGYSVFAETDSGSIFGTHKFQDEPYVFDSDNNLFKLDSTGAKTVIGSVPDDPLDGSAGAIFSDNGEVLCMVLPGSNRSYFYEPGGLGFYQIVDPVFQGYEAQSGGVRSVTFLDGYFVFNTYETTFISSLVTVNNGQDFDATDFVKPFLKEKAKRVIAWNGDLVVFGESESKMYANVGGTDFPFQEIPGATFEKGLQETKGVVIFDNTFFFYGSGTNEDPSVWQYAGGGNVKKISTDSIDRDYRGYSNTRFGEYSFQYDGRPFVGFYINGKAFFYDLQTSNIKGFPTWVLYSSTGTSGVFVAGDAFIEAFDRILTFRSDACLEFDKDTNYSIITFGGDLQESDRTCQFSSAYLQGQSNSLFINRLELRMETGTGLNPNESTTSTNPEVLLETSTDGGRTWQSRGVRSSGMYQKFGTRLTWNRLNYTPTSTIFRFSCTTGVPVRFHRIDIDATAGGRNA